MGLKLESPRGSFKGSESRQGDARRMRPLEQRNGNWTGWESAHRKKPQKSTCPGPAAPPFLKFWVEVKKKQYFQASGVFAIPGHQLVGVSTLCFVHLLLPQGLFPPAEGTEEL